MQNSKFKNQNYSVKLKIFALSFSILIFTLSIPLPTMTVGSSGILIVKIKSADDLARLHSYGNTELLFNNIYRLQPTTYNLQPVLRQQPWVEFVEREGQVQTTLNPADPLFVLDVKELSKQWYLPKMKVHQAWEQTTGSAQITVAVVDTGINAKHEDLNDGRVTKGFLSYCQVPHPTVTDDCLVRVTGGLSPGVNSDDNGHGTIVAGIIGAISNNNKGIAGINWNVRLMPVKVLDSTGTGRASDVALGIKWAADNGAKVINLSIGGPGLDGAEVLTEAISYAFKKGVLIVAASGNDGVVNGGNMNVNPIMPVCADGGQNMVVGVVAVDSADQKAKFSNYGSNCTDISAPGAGTFVDRQQKQGLVSTYYDPTRPGENDLYVYAVGTSVAAPMVSAAAALMAALFPDLDVRALRDRLISSVDSIDEVNLSGCDGSCVGQIGRGRLNVYKAVTMSTGFIAGTLVKSPDSQVFLIEKGLKRPVSDFVYKLRFGTLPITPAVPGQLDSFPAGLPVAPPDGSVIKDIASPTVYLVEGEEVHAMSYLAFVSRDLGFQNVITLPTSEVAGYPRGTDAPVLSGARVKASNHPAVYVLNNGIRQLLSYFVYKQRGFDAKPVVELPPEELAVYPVHSQSFLYPPSDGTLMRGDLNATVYLFEAGKRRGLNLAAFQNRGFSFPNVSILPQSEADGYEMGENIVE